MESNVNSIWVYLAQSPLLWLTVTLVAYQGAYWLYQRANFMPLFNPVLVSVLLLVILLAVTQTPYQKYFDGAQFIHFLLGPATVALAIPLYQYFGKLKQMAVPLSGALLVGSVSAVVSVVWIGQLAGLSDITLRSLMPKSVTTPIAMGISEQIGGLPSLTAVLVILTGILGGIVAKEILDALRVKERSVQGFAIGLTAHGIGTARAFQADEETGAFSGLGMGLNGAVTAIIVPILVRLFG